MENYRNLDVNDSYTALINKIGISYLGGVSTSHKTELSELNGVLTYGVYLAPWNLSGYQVCAGGRVAVVFDGHRLPATFDGWRVIDGNSYDFRFKDPGRVIVGLNYHPVANDYKKINGVRTYVAPVTPFVIRPEDKRNVF